MRLSGRPFQKAARVGLLAAVILATSQMLAPAGAEARTASFGAEFLPFSRLGEGATMGTEVNFAGTEYHGEVAPLTKLTINFPPGSGLSDAGFPTCSSEVLQVQIWWDGPCPLGSVAGGRVGSFTAVVHFEGRAASETGEVWPIFGPEEKLLLVLEGHTPLGLEFLIEGHIVPASAPHGPALVLEAPLIETEHGGPAVSLTSLFFELGATREEGGNEAWSVTSPGSCSGKMVWSAEAAFNHEASEPISTNETDCLDSGSRGRTATTLAISNSAPYEQETVTYTATVKQLGGGVLNEGAVAFYEGIKGGPICGFQPIVASGEQTTVSCQTSYTEPFGHKIRAVYSGDESLRGSTSPVGELRVIEGSAPPPPPQQGAHFETDGPDGPPQRPIIPGPLVATNVVTPAQIAAALQAVLSAKGKAAQIGALLKHAGTSVGFSAPEAGTLSIQWLYRPKGSGAKHKALILVASGRLVFSHVGAAKVHVTLTTQGRRLLKAAWSLPILVKSSFTPSGGKPLTITRQLVLRN